MAKGPSTEPERAKTPLEAGADSIIPTMLPADASMSPPSSSTNELQVDVERVARLASFGTLVQGPLLFSFYRWLDKRFEGTCRRAVVKKVLLDQVVCAPVVYLLMFPYLGYLKGLGSHGELLLWLGRNPPLPPPTHYFSFLLFQTRNRGENAARRYPNLRRRLPGVDSC